MQDDYSDYFIYFFFLSVQTSSFQGFFPPINHPPVASVSSEQSWICSGFGGPGKLLSCIHSCAWALLLCWITGGWRCVALLWVIATMSVWWHKCVSVFPQRWKCRCQEDRMIVNVTFCLSLLIVSIISDTDLCSCPGVYLNHNKISTKPQTKPLRSWTIAFVVLRKEAHHQNISLEAFRGQQAHTHVGQLTCLCYRVRLLPGSRRCADASGRNVSSQQFNTSLKLHTSFVSLLSCNYLREVLNEIYDGFSSLVEVDYIKMGSIWAANMDMRACPTCPMVSYLKSDWNYLVFRWATTGKSLKPIPPRPPPL